jgi:NAD-dependent SIR2 family protein deacetylase
MKEELSKYWCSKCRNQISNPKWRDVTKSVIAAYCPRCDEEIARKIK